MQQYQWEGRQSKKFRAEKEERHLEGIRTKQKKDNTKMGSKSMGG
jgi:hypothetical protein